ncbi:kinase-like domain-containing protein [Phyllosticta capitalensis]|uniref:Kinase-like domain-containing protein n=1 Tax=Phyllosticta capitalensis TaxID=121624 RepID=A0ABR1YCG8_9PEZI
MPLVNARSQAELQAQRTKLTNSYNDLLGEFSSKDLRTVGNYQLGRLIGKGSFGKVYLAYHKLTNGSKVVLKSADKNDSNLAREIHHHRQFLHPHIARLYEVIVTESLVWLALEYCPGDELYNKLLETGPMESPKVQRIFTQLVGAVSYVHSKSCVHRDLKLENILLDKHGNVKLVDFGFTREYEGKSNYLQTWCGTICYSAPEMLKGEKYAGEKVDVWSLGIILYALLCGELPFDDDDENTTKVKILKEEPKYPEHMAEQAKELVVKLLSKRPLLRPSLSELLQHPWLAEHAPQQQAILKLQQPPPFTTDLEKETLQRMRSAGVDIDQVIENVLAQRCDSLAGWWALLIEKEERKAKRRERKRKEREAEAKSLRRLSAASRASSRLDRLAPTIREVDESVVPILGDPPKSRGRNRDRGASATSATPELPLVPEASNLQKPLPPEKDRRVSSSRTRPGLPPKEYNRSRRSSSMLHVVTTNPELLSTNGYVPKRRRKYQQPFFAQLASLKHWFKESAKRARSKSPGSKNSKSPKVNQGKLTKSDEERRPSAATSANTVRPSTHPRPETQPRTTYPQRPRVSTRASNSSYKRTSISPSPMTPRSTSYRRSSAGLQSRKSTSSSISSIRTIHHAHTHSKTSSTSSASISSPSVSNRAGRSPHQSVKVLPNTPTGSQFPSDIRVVRGAATANSEGNAAFGSLPLHGSGVLFARRKRSPFKGPGLNMGMHHGSPNGSRVRDASGSRTSSVQGRRSGEMVIQEEEEDELEDVEEVETFSPVLEPGSYLVEEPPEMSLSEEAPHSPTTITTT